MTTQLKGKHTYFCLSTKAPVVRRSRGAGNPENPSGYATSYLWEKVLTKDILMDILQRYMHLDVETKVTIKNGKEIKKESKN